MGDAQALDLAVRLGDCLLATDHLACFVVENVAVLGLSAFIEELLALSDQRDIPDGLVVREEITRREDHLARHPWRNEGPMASLLPAWSLSPTVLCLRLHFAQLLPFVP